MARFRSTGSLLLVNPRKRKAKKNPVRKSATKRRTTRRTVKNRATTRRRRTVKRNAAPRRRRVVKNRASSARRRTVKRNSSHRRRRRTRRNPVMTHGVVRVRRTNGRRRATPRVAMRNGRRKGGKRRVSRRNPSFASFGAMFRKIPVVGGLLADMAMLVPHGILGAVSVEPTLMAIKYLGPYYPDMPAAAVYPITGLLLGGLIQAIGGKLGVSKQTRDMAAVAAVAGGGAVGYYKFRTDQDASVETEMAGMMYGCPNGLGEMGPTFTAPYAQYGSVLRVYGDAEATDVAACPGYIDAAEAEVAQEGLGAWFSRFPMSRRVMRQGPGSQHAGQPGHRWAWLIKLIGWPRFVQLSALPPHVQAAYIARLKGAAMRELPGPGMDAGIEQAQAEMGSVLLTY